MGILDRASVPIKKQDETLTPQEIEFIMKKMRSAAYVGDEFELFYTIFVKLSKELDQVKK